MYNLKKHVAKPEGKIDHFCKDDTVVSRNTFLPLGQAERNETTWSKVDVEKRVKTSRSVSVKLSSNSEIRPWRSHSSKSFLDQA